MAFDEHADPGGALNETWHAQVQMSSSEPPAPRPALADLLEEEGLVTSEQIYDAIEEGSQTGERFREVLLRRGLITEAGLARLLARQWSLPFLEAADVGTSVAASYLLTPDQAAEIGAQPISIDEGRVLVALADPSEERFERVRSHLGPETEFVVVTTSALAQLLGEETPPQAGERLHEEVVTEEGAPIGEAGAEGPARDESPAAIGAALDELAAAIVAAERQTAALVSARNRFEELERRLAAATAVLEEERSRRAELEAQLAQRNDLLATLRTKLGDLSGTLEATG
jgi:hypothetical protein